MIVYCFFADSPVTVRSLQGALKKSKEYLMPLSYSAFKSLFWKSVTGNFYQSGSICLSIFTDFLLTISYAQSALRKELVIATFVECFRTASLRKSHWHTLLLIQTKCLCITFFAESPLIVRSLHGVLWKEQAVLIAPFVQRFITFIWEKSYW